MTTPVGFQGGLYASFSNSHKCLAFFSLISASFSPCSLLSPSPFLSSYFCLLVPVSDVCFCSVSIPASPSLCFSVSDMNSLVASTSLCLSPLHIVFFFSCSLKGDPNHEQRSEGPCLGQLSRRGSPPPSSSLCHVGCSPGSLCFLSTGVCGLRAEGPSCLSSGETCVQNVSSVALIQLQAAGYGTQ